MSDHRMSNPTLTNLDEDGWAIDDGEVAHAKSPETYWIPSLDERQSLQPGMYAKLRFYIRVENEKQEIEDCAERMWVEVFGRLGEWYRGLLANQPTSTDEIEIGMEVWFQPRHIINISGPE